MIGSATPTALPYNTSKPPLQNQQADTTTESLKTNAASKAPVFTEINGKRGEAIPVDKSEIMKTVIDFLGPTYAQEIGRIQELNAKIAWLESPEGIAAQQEQIAKQNAAPVELAIYQGGELVAFKSEGAGFTARASLSDILPDDWGSMSSTALRDALMSQLTDRGFGTGFSIRTDRDGLVLSTGQAVDEFNPK